MSEQTVAVQNLGAARNALEHQIEDVQAKLTEATTRMQRANKEVDDLAEKQNRLQRALKGLSAVEEALS